MLGNSIPGTLRVLLGALIVSAILFTMTGQLRRGLRPQSVPCPAQSPRRLGLDQAAGEHRDGATGIACGTLLAPRDRIGHTDRIDPMDRVAMISG